MLRLRIACVPWILYFVSHKKITAGMLVMFAMTGMLGVKTATLFRAHAGTGLLLFTLVVTVGLYQVKPAARGFWLDNATPARRCRPGGC